jgi:hypothetical protein
MGQAEERHGKEWEALKTNKKKNAFKHTFVPLIILIYPTISASMLNIHLFLNFVKRRKNYACQWGKGGYPLHPVPTPLTCTCSKNMHAKNIIVRVIFI